MIAIFLLIPVKGLKLSLLDPFSLLAFMGLGLWLMVIWFSCPTLGNLSFFLSYGLLTSLSENDLSFFKEV